MHFSWTALRGAVAGFLLAAPLVTFQNALAQVIPDTTLGNEGSTVISTPDGVRLEGGAVRGTGLFHSFSDFNIDQGQQVYFTNPAGITNILTRITGNQPSAIDGTLGVNGPANLFLLNPNGIVFGEAAQLDIAGSFTATTVDSLWIDGYEFSTVQPDVPSPLLSLNVAPGIQYGASTRNSLLENRGILAVDPQQNLTLLGGDVRNLGSLLAPGGQVELSGNQINTADGSVITTNSNGDSGDIILSALGDITVGLLDSHSTRDNGGNIDVTSLAGSITVTDNLISDGDHQSGNITITAAENIAINGQIATDSSITTGTIADFSGTAGDITITAGGDLDLRSPQPISRFGDISANGLQSGQITLTSGGALAADNYRIINRMAGNGVGGDIRISAQSMDLNETSIGTLSRDESILLFLGPFQDAVGGSVFINADEDIVMRNTGIFAGTDFGTADTGDLVLNARSLQVIRTPGFNLPVTVEAYGLSSATSLTGDGGDVIVNVTDSIDLIGSLPGPSNLSPTGSAAEIIELARNGSSIFAGGFGFGKAGAIILNTKQLNLRNGAGISTSSVLGEGGNLSIVAEDINLQGTSGIFTSTDFLGGDAGDLEIQAETVTLTGGARVITTSISPGAAGDMSLVAEALSIQDGSLLASNTFGAGDGGILTVQARDRIEVVGINAAGDTASRISSNSLASGDSGPVNITTQQLIVKDGGEITTATLGNGAGADIDIVTDSLKLNNGQINASTTTVENGGNIRIDASESVEIVGNGFTVLKEQIIDPALDGTLGVDNFTQGILTVAAGEGSAGNVEIRTSEFIARNGALVATTTLNNGAGGDINITATNDLQLEGSLLATGSFTAATSGDIELQTQRMRASGGAQAITTTFGTGKAGDLTVVATESIDLIDPTDTGIASGLLASSFETATGTGGDIQVTTGEFRIRDGATVTVSGEGQGDAGNIGIGARLLSLDQGNITATSASGEGGNVALQIDDLLFLRNGSIISTTAGQAGAGGNGGNITFGDGFIIAVPGENSDITANAFEGNGGNITIATQGLLGIDFRENLTPFNDITASSQFGLDGEVIIEQFNPELEPSELELPDQLASADQITARCAAGSNNSLVTTGRGGLPTDPRQLWQGQIVLQDWRRPDGVTGEVIEQALSPEEVVEAQDWLIDDQGRVQLVAQASQMTKLPHTQCVTARRAG